MTWGRVLENALASKGISKELKEWIAIAKDMPKWTECSFVYHVPGPLSPAELFGGKTPAGA